MALITREYAEEQARLHSEQDAYGSRGFNWGYTVAGIALIEGASTILDYGCGKGTLGKTLRRAGLQVREYDPGIQKFSKLPEASDLVVALDVLEHIEPDCLDSVLDHLAVLTRRVLFVAIACLPSKRWLSDGRNTHLIVEEGGWWRPKFEDRGLNVRRVWNTGLREWVALMQRGSSDGKR